MSSQESETTHAGGSSHADLTSVADLIYAVAMLKNTPRSGYAFLGTGHESVAEHCFGTTFIGYILASKAHADISKTILLCLFHDLHEAVTGDFNYVNHRYDKADAARGLADICGETDAQGPIMAAWREFEAKESQEALLANDADQLDMICSLRKELARGNEFAAEWLKSAVQRLATPQGRQLCEAIMATSPHHWWYDQVDQKWWINREAQ